jgi:hypothetical protein
VGSVLPRKLVRNSSPNLILLGCVLDVGDRIARLMGRSNGCDVAPPGAVCRVGKPGMIRREFKRRQHLTEFLPGSGRYIQVTGSS